MLAIFSFFTAIALMIAFGIRPSRDQFATVRLEAAIQHALDSGTIVVAAAGNQGETAEPATIRGVLAVGAIGENGRVMGSSARSCQRCFEEDGVDLVAPGERILTTQAGGGYTRFSGTSAAAAFVTGAAALLLGHAPGRENADQTTELSSVLIQTARPVPGQRTAVDAHAGHGMLQAPAALNAWKSQQPAVATLR